MKLDASDRKILKWLQVDGRMTNQELSEKCNISPSACHERFKRLRDEGYIKGFTAILNPDKFEKYVVVYAQVRININNAKAYEDFTTAATKLTEVVECYMLLGGFDYLLKIMVADTGAYKTFLSQSLSELPGVREIRTYAVIDEVKRSLNLPL
jgi:Lrp/AsnC family transcriptional regulator, leucine-responsive regulatory protein